MFGSSDIPLIFVVYKRDSNMNNAVTFKKVEAGEYSILLNGEVLATTSKGSYDWAVYDHTDAFTVFYNNLGRYANWMVEDQSYDTKAEIKACFQSAADTLTK